MCNSSLANFSLGGEEKSLYEFEGRDMKGASGKDAWSLSLPKRVTKTNYDENEYYRKAMSNEKGAPKPPKPLGVQDFQFFDAMRLEEIRQVEMRHYEVRKALYDRRYAPDEEREAFERQMKEAADAAPPLTAEQHEEREKLLSEGFATWSKKDLANFVRGLEEFGRSDLPAVATFVEGKSPKEVAQYAVSFFERYAEIKDWEKLMRRIEAGEARLARRLELDACLARKVQSTSEPWNRLTIDYTILGAPSRPSSAFTIENDRHLICTALQVGYGRWEELVREVRKSWLFKFDWHMKTRNAAELGKRVEYLTKLVEKEQNDEDVAKKEEEKKSKKAGGAGGKRGADDEPAGDAKRRKS